MKAYTVKAPTAKSPLVTPVESRHAQNRQGQVQALLPPGPTTAPLAIPSTSSDTLDIKKFPSPSSGAETASSHHPGIYPVITALPPAQAFGVVRGHLSWPAGKGNKPSTKTRKKTTQLKNDPAIAGEFRHTTDYGGDSQLLPSHGNKCGCPGCCSTQLTAQRAKKNSAPPVAQLFTTVTLNDGARTETGKSGNEEYTRHGFNLWPKLKASFEANVKSKVHQGVDETAEGEAEPREYVRTPYMCAEPNALAIFLRSYNVVGHGLTPQWLEGLKFPKLALDNKTGKSIPPCDVCEQWVASEAPMAVKNIAVDEMKNKAQLDEEERLSLEAAEKRKALEEEMERKEALRTERVKANSASEQKTATAAILLGKISLPTLSGLIGSMVPKKGKKAKVSAETLNAWMKDRLSNWIYSLTTANVHIIKAYETFDDGQQEEFRSWVADNPGELD